MLTSQSRSTLLLAAATALLIGGAAFTGARRDRRGELPAADQGETRQDDQRSEAQRLWVRMNEAERQGKYDEALDCNHAIRAQHGDLYLVNLRAGWLHSLRQDYKTAAESYRHAAELAPGAVSPLLGLARCQAALGDADEAIKTLTALLALDPMNAAAIRTLAGLYFQRQNYAYAEAYYLKLVYMYPEDLDVAAELAWCQLYQKRPDQARAIFDAILIASPDHASSLKGWAACIER